MGGARDSAEPRPWTRPAGGARANPCRVVQARQTWTAIGVVLRFTPHTHDGSGKAMKELALVVAALTFPVCSAAISGDWTQASFSSMATGTVGTLAKVSGLIDDSQGARAAELVVTCADNRTSVFVSADYLVFGGDVARVQYIIDNGPIQRAYWNVCAGDLCAGLWNGAGIPFIRSLLDATILRMTLTRSFGRPIHATFAVEGAREALKDVRRQCGWSAP